MTISDKKAVLEALRNGGRIEGVTYPIIYSYRSRPSGELLFALFTKPEFDDLQGQETPYCMNVVVLMVNGILTKDGQTFILTEEPQSPGICPICKAKGLDYGDHSFEDDRVLFDWTCPQCGRTGKEIHVLDFVEHGLDPEEDGE